jgi:pimeloyl-CoA dehydrogenase
MDFKLSEQQLMLKQAVAAGLSPSRAPNGAAQWRAMVDLGLTGLLVDEALGGVGLGPIECMLAAAEIGRNASIAPFASTAAASAFYQAIQGASARERTAAIASGSLRASVAFVDSIADPDPNAVSTRAEKSGDGYVLSGAKWLVLDGLEAELFVVPARDAGGALLGFEVPCDAPGLTVRAAPLLDGRSAADLTLFNVNAPRAALLSTPEEFANGYARAFDIAALCACAETVGAMAAILEITIDYMKTRKQFGAALSTLQVIQHRLVDMRIALEGAEAMSAAAAMKLAGADVHTARRHIAGAKAFSDRVARTVAQHCIQLHGAMGLTDECRASAFVKRITSNAHVFGDADFHARRFSELSA